ncbi:MerR family transcriptional regulator [Bifidobacterium asteroides]|uniref:Transcriptional regulator n=1 Tax=Bifidobacterium asteroides TaxID=1684 RepID=A0A318M3D5_9BIFI|nr:MerR family transcriptional regulator [Bifidobacterium asteroides]PXY82767.1 transcriptional regulator [Bifidobacterium asteroides]
MAEEVPTLVQGELFSAEQAEGLTRGYRGTVAAKVAGITYRQLDYWARKRIVEPSIKASHGSGSRRLYSFKDVVILAVLKRLLDAGVNLVNATSTVAYLERRTVSQLEHVTVVCDGDQVVECSSPDQVFTLMQSGRAVFAISIGAIWHRMDLELQTCDHVDLTTGQLTPGLPERPIDELTAMRLRQRLEHQHERRQRAA